MQSTLISLGSNRLHKRDGNLVAFDADKIRRRQGNRGICRG